MPSDLEQPQKKVARTFNATSDDTAPAKKVDLEDVFCAAKNNFLYVS